MRKKNSLSEFAQERSELLLKNFRASLARQSQISMMKAFREAAEAPAPRFWVSEERTLRIIKKMLGGEDPTMAMNLEKRKMYREIFSRVCEMMVEQPHATLGDIVFQVVNDEAPSFYISPNTVRNILSNLR